MTLLGSTVGDDDDIPIWVPSADTPLVPLRAWFVAHGNSVVDQIKRMQQRNRSHVLFTDKFDPGGNWTVIVSKIRVIGEVAAYLQLELQRKNSKLSVPADGNMENAIVGVVASGFNPESQAALSSGTGGRLAAGAILNNGQVKLTAINSGADIEVGDTISLEGYYPLDDWRDSGA